MHSTYLHTKDLGEYLTGKIYLNPLLYPTVAVAAVSSKAIFLLLLTDPVKGVLCLVLVFVTSFFVSFLVV